MKWKCTTTMDVKRTHFGRHLFVDADRAAKGDWLRIVGERALTLHL